MLAGWLDISPQYPGIDWSGVWGMGPDDFFIVGNHGVIMRYQTGRPWTVWELVSGVNLEAIWGIDNGSIFAVGQNGAIFHFDGYVWEEMESGTTYPLLAVHGRGGAGRLRGRSGRDHRPLRWHCLDAARKWRLRAAGSGLVPSGHRNGDRR
jgi:hypothetical protein